MTKKTKDQPLTAAEATEVGTWEKSVYADEQKDAKVAAAVSDVTDASPILAVAEEPPPVAAVTDPSPIPEPAPVPLSPTEQFLNEARATAAVYSAGDIVSTGDLKRLLGTAIELLGARADTE